MSIGDPVCPHGLGWAVLCNRCSNPQMYEQENFKQPYAGNSMKTELFQKAKTGKIKHLILEVTGDKLSTTWFTTSDGTNSPSKSQNTVETFKGKNIGKSNETSDEQQAVLECEAKIRKKTEEGYVDSLSKVAKSEVFDIYQQLPKQFAPSKAISKLKENPFDGTWLAERKFDGVCLLLHGLTNEKIVYSLRIADITKIVSCVPAVMDSLVMVEDGDLVLGELVCIDPSGKEDTSWLKGVTDERTTQEKAQARYNEATMAGFKFEFHVFDILFCDGDDVSKESFSTRLAMTHSFGNRELVPLTKELDEKARLKGWEGFILRREDSTIGYSLRGKPTREGAYKRKFVETTEVIVTGAEQGSGKQEVFFNSFKIAQYDTDGKLIDCANTGPGKLGETGLKEITDTLLSKGYKLGDVTLKEKDWFVLEIEYQNRLPKNDAGQMAFFLPISQRIRTDKPIKECVCE